MLILKNYYKLILSNIKLIFYMKENKLPNILTLKQACEILNCHPNTLRNWEKEGTIECK